MNNANQDNKRKTEWSQITLHKDPESGVQIVVKKSDHRRPAVEFALGTTHGKTGLFTPHNLVRYDNEKPFTGEEIDKYFEGLARLKEQLKATLVENIALLQKTIPKQRPNSPHSRKPNEPGKTGKTARKKAAKMAGGQKPAAQPGA